jgi:SAM-dependent methyltransferase
MTDGTNRAGNRYSTGCLSKDLPTELVRLQMQEQLLDPHTIDHLECLPIEPSWRCLEIGAGAGSIAYWLAERCPSGRVVAADIDPRFLDATRLPNLTVEGIDIGTADYPQHSFDLIHARMVLCHLAQRERILAAAARWLAPGGWLVIEEPYFFEPQTSPYPPVQRLFRGVERKLAGHGADMRWARRLPGLVAQMLGSPPVVTAAASPIGGEPGTLNHELSRINVLQVGPLLVADSLITDADLTEALRLFDDPGFVDVMSVNLGVRGRKAA